MDVPTARRTAPHHVGRGHRAQCRARDRSGWIEEPAAHEPGTLSRRPRAFPPNTPTTHRTSQGWVVVHPRRHRWRRPARLLAVAAGAVTLLSAGPASAATLTDAKLVRVAAANPLGCAADNALSKPFARFGDFADYALAPRGDFESGAAGWLLTGGAKVVAGNEPAYVGAAPDRSSLALPFGSTATSPTLRIDGTYRTSRSSLGTRARPSQRSRSRSCTRRLPLHPARRHGRQLADRRRRRRSLRPPLATTERLRAVRRGVVSPAASRLPPTRSCVGSARGEAARLTRERSVVLESSRRPLNAQVRRWTRDTSRGPRRPFLGIYVGRCGFPDPRQGRGIASSCRFGAYEARFPIFRWRPAPPWRRAAFRRGQASSELVAGPAARDQQPVRAPRTARGQRCAEAARATSEHYSVRVRLVQEGRGGGRPSNAAAAAGPSAPSGHPASKRSVGASPAPSRTRTSAGGIR
jgi:hypothetical protein